MLRSRKKGQVWLAMSLLAGIVLLGYATAQQPAPASLPPLSSNDVTTYMKPSGSRAIPKASIPSSNVQSAAAQIADQPPASGQVPDQTLPTPRSFPALDGPPSAPVEPETPLEIVEFRNLSVNEAMRLLSQQSGLKVVPSAEAGKLSISLFLQNVTPSTAVAELAQANGLVYRREPTTGIVRLFTTKENQRNLAGFREDQTRVFTLLYPNVVSVSSAIRDLYGDRVQLGYGANDASTIQELQYRFSRFDLLNSRTLGIGLPQGGVGGTGVGGVGIGAGGLSGGGFGGVGLGVGGLGTGGLGGFGGGFGAQGGFGTAGRQGTTGRDVNDRETDTRPDQRLQSLSAEEIQQLETAFTDKGTPDRTVLLDLLRRRPANIYVTMLPANNQLAVRTSDPAVMNQIAELVARLDVATPVVLLEVKVLSVNLGDDFRSVFDYQFTDGITTAGGFTSGNILPPTADLVSGTARRQSAINPGALAGNPGTDGDLVFQVVSANFRARMQLLEDRNRVTELATPLLMTANNEVSRVFVGESRPITIGFNPPQVIANGIGANTNLAGTPITALQDLGTTLLITPNINNDRTVTLRLLQENSRVLTGGGTIPVPNNNGGITQVPVDIVSRQNLSGTIVAKDGLTLAVGGLIQENVTDNRAQVPFLGRLPGVGFFFRRQFTRRTKTELIVLVRPFILATPNESAGATDILLRSLSVHPVSCAPQEITQMGTFTPAEVPRPSPPTTRFQNIFQLHSVSPKPWEEVLRSPRRGNP